MLVPAVPAVLYYFTDYVPEGIFPGRVNLGLTFSASRNLFSVVWNMAVFALIPVSTLLFDVAPETRSLTVWLVPNHNVFNCIAFPFADPLGKGLRAAGDVKFTVVWSVITTFGVRLLASVGLAIVFGMGVIGIALAMSFDWCVRAVAFYIRFRGGKWKKYQLI